MTAKMSKCCTCGAEWETGKDGTHSCSFHLIKKLNVACKIMTDFLIGWESPKGGPIPIQRMRDFVANWP